MTMPLSENAERLARHLVHTSSDGLRTPLGWAEFAEKFSAEPEELAEAIYELERGGLLSVSQAMSTPQGISHAGRITSCFGPTTARSLATIRLRISLPLQSICLVTINQAMFLNYIRRRVGLSDDLTLHWPTSCRNFQTAM